MNFNITGLLRGVSLILCLGSLSATISAQYSMVVETEPATTEGLTRYKIYVVLDDVSDRVSAVFGTDIEPMWIEAPEGVFNSPYNAGWSASGLNPKFLESMPSMADDSYATIGLSLPASSGAEGSENPMMVEDPAAPWLNLFKVDGETRLDINTLLGGSWFIVKSASNGLGDKDRKVLIAAITTAGTVKGVINVQIFPKGNGKESKRVKFTFEGEGKTTGSILPK